MINLNKLALNKNKIFLIILVFLIMVYLDFTLLVKRQLESLKVQEPKIKKLKNDLDTLEKDLVKIKDLKNKQLQTNKRLLLKAKKFIAEHQIPSVLENISSIANKNNVNIMQIKSVKESTSKAPATGKFSPLLITLDLFGDYHGVGKFINDLENASIFITVENMKITSQTTDYLKQKVNLVLRTYVKK